MTSRASRAEQRLHVDWTRCDGHGTCADLLPDVITRDEWGFPIVHAETSIAGRARERVALAVEVCPMLALRVVSDSRR